MVNDFVIAKIWNVYGLDFNDNNKVLFYLNRLKNATWENTADVVHTRGGAGSPVIASFVTNKSSRITIESAVFNSGLLASQSDDANMSEDDVVVPMVQEATIPETTTYTVSLKYVPVDSTGATISVEMVDSGIVLQKGDTASATAFTFATNVLTFDASYAGEKIRIYYTTEASEAFVMDNKGIADIKYATIVAEVQLVNACSSTYHMGAIILDRASIDQNWTIAVSDSAEAAVQNAVFEALAGCETEGSLSRLIIYSTDDLTLVTP